MSASFIASSYVHQVPKWKENEDRRQNYFRLYRLVVVTINMIIRWFLFEGAIIIAIGKKRMRCGFCFLNKCPIQANRTGKLWKCVCVCVCVWWNSSWLGMGHVSGVTFFASHKTYIDNNCWQNVNESTKHSVFFIKWAKENRKWLEKWRKMKGSKRQRKRARAD